MRVEPPCVAKRLSNTEPGELVKLHWGGHAMRAIVASIDYQGQRDQALVFLDSTGTESLFGRHLQGPWTTRADTGDDPVVLSFGSDYSFRVDPATARMVSSGARRPAGALLVREGGPALVADLPNDPARRTITFDAVTGAVGPQAPVTDEVAVLDWELRLGGARDDHPAFFAFKAA